MFNDRGHGAFHGLYKTKRGIKVRCRKTSEPLVKRFYSFIGRLTGSMNLSSGYDIEVMRLRANIPAPSFEIVA